MHDWEAPARSIISPVFSPHCFKFANCSDGPVYSIEELPGFGVLIFARGEGGRSGVCKSIKLY